MTIEELRKSVDKLDRRLLELLNQRAELTQQIAHHKRRRNDDQFVPSRERQIFDNLQTHNRGPLPDAAVYDIFRQIIAANRALERPMKISFLGPLYTFSHLATLRKFGSLPKMLPAATVEEVFKAVENRRAGYGVVPVENSTEGTVRPTLDMFSQSSLLICSELYLDIEHFLFSKSTLDEIKRVYAPPQVLAQCREWLRGNLAAVELIEVSSSSRGAELAAEEPGAAAIGTLLAAEHYGLSMLAERIEDLPGNRTRFLIIGHTANPPTGKDKTSIIFAVPHQPGALHAALAVLYKYDINMTMIESRPTRQAPWKYAFFVDLQGHRDDPGVSKALSQLQTTCVFVKVLGSYPEAE